ncbi:hypothetical protein ZRA01_33300 [Zoogloea ramigera]|uniref:Uncharacterized protein n=1 Tax=Zoogloea ramigera TaxID=350 RepID=A0A4Y4D1V8_ZOORA|nr:hypothetical protein ZRA01_33300 [Zoogloea ramigera]
MTLSETDEPVVSPRQKPLKRQRVTESALNDETNYTKRERPSDGSSGIIWLDNSVQDTTKMLEGFKGARCILSKL